MNRTTSLAMAFLVGAASGSMAVFDAGTTSRRVTANDDAIQNDAIEHFQFEQLSEVDCPPHHRGILGSILSARRDNVSLEQFEEGISVALDEYAHDPSAKADILFAASQGYPDPNNLSIRLHYSSRAIEELQLSKLVLLSRLIEIQTVAARVAHQVGDSDGTRHLCRGALRAFDEVEEFDVTYGREEHLRERRACERAYALAVSMYLS